jgi:hypothetical protein
MISVGGDFSIWVDKHLDIVPLPELVVESFEGATYLLLFDPVGAIVGNCRDRLAKS